VSPRTTHITVVALPVHLWVGLVVLRFESVCPVRRPGYPVTRLPGYPVTIKVVRSHSRLIRVILEISPT
jgi:hypothetical protein